MKRLKLDLIGQDYKTMLFDFFKKITRCFFNIKKGKAYELFESVINSAPIDNLETSRANFLLSLGFKLNCVGELLQYDPVDLIGPKITWMNSNNLVFF